MSTVRSVTPVLFVRDVAASAAWYEARLGFTAGFLYGEPVYYGAVERDGIAIHLRHVDQPNFAELAAREPSLILASVEVTGVAALYDEAIARGAEIVQPLTVQEWGGTDFQVRDPDGNRLSFVEFGMQPE